MDGVAGTNYKTKILFLLLMKSPSQNLGVGGSSLH